MVLTQRRHGSNLCKDWVFKNWHVEELAALVEQDRAHFPPRRVRPVTRTMLIDLIGLPSCWLHASAMPRHAARLDAGPYVLARHTMAVQLWVRQSTPGPRIFDVNVGRQLPLLCERGLRTAFCRHRRAPSNLFCPALTDHPVFLFSCGCLAGTRVPRADSDEMVEWRNFWSTCRYCRPCAVCLVGCRPGLCQLFHYRPGLGKQLEIGAEPGKSHHHHSYHPFGRGKLLRSLGENLREIPVVSPSQRG